MNLLLITEETKIIINNFCILIKQNTKERKTLSYVLLIMFQF